MNVLIAGSTGLVGSFALTKLLEDPRISKVVVLGRSKQANFHPKIYYVQAELDKLKTALPQWVCSFAQLLQTRFLKFQRLEL